MIPTSPICNVCEYSQCGVKCPPTAAQAAKGLNPLGSLPSQLWNSLWHDANEAVNCIKYATDTLIDEINSVLTEAGIAADVQCTDQLFQAIACIIHAVDTTGGKSSVKSSTTPGMVSIDQCGYMTVNNVGNTNCLNVACKEVVGALNEINTTYGNAYGSLWQDTHTVEAAKADNNHSVNGSTYGIGSASAYGHLRISDTCNALATDCQHTAASQKAVADIWALVNATTGLGNTAGSAFGTASAGSATTAARSDHVHPIPSLVTCTSGLVGSPLTSYGTMITGCTATPNDSICRIVPQLERYGCSLPSGAYATVYDPLTGQHFYVPAQWGLTNGWRSGNVYGMVMGHVCSTVIDDKGTRTWDGPIFLAVAPYTYVPTYICAYWYGEKGGQSTIISTITNCSFVPGNILGSMPRTYFLI